MKLVLCAVAHAACVTCAASALPALAQEASPPPGRPEPKVERLVVEDDSARVEELRVRGQTQRLVVHLKKGGASYEILPADGARDLSQGTSRAAAGQRVWHVLNF
jgi:hypothetical protein